MDANKVEHLYAVKRGPLWLIPSYGGEKWGSLQKDIQLFTERPVVREGEEVVELV